MRYIVSLLIVSCTLCPAPQSDREETTRPAFSSVALRVHHMDRMVAFYSEAFGIRFREVDTSGLKSRFGKLNGVLIKLVPLRKQPDFEGFPSHQPGFTVPDIARVISLAKKHGGRELTPPTRRDKQLHAAVRDPDGNTIELYQALDSASKQ